MDCLDAVPCQFADTAVLRKMCARSYLELLTHQAAVGHEVEAAPPIQRSNCDLPKLEQLEQFLSSFLLAGEATQFS